uniref:Uncharacterized protein n=1 Tax=Salvator merianae TaxID=96440 RepID=A0A8D0C197_SALMN
KNPLQKERKSCSLQKLYFNEAVSYSLSAGSLILTFVTRKYNYCSGRNWFTLDLVQILQDDRKAAEFKVAIMSGPAEYSFHCQLVGTSKDFGVVLLPNNTEAEEWEVVISDFQIQAYNVKDNRFSYASDCTTFFTPAIWMGLVTSLVLLLILTFGIHMIVNLTTNNRFDDRNGPALSVPQAD